ncbi:hypothetical protein EGW08_002031 [Elysia chlorotica]|uniref:EF-hand domain-containing protein n=1 Tax=Elysia chlorotica TaxID=188477 RepID=A0A433U8Y6_ELYCH|nr:hypothetical protein EGW08_002031 [Elysia chlorotica]
MKRTPVVPRQESLVLPVVINPFSYDRKLSFCDKLQVAFMTVTIVPIRAILIFFFLVLGWLLAHIALAFRTEEEKLKPMTGWRTFFTVPMVVLGRALFIVLGFWVVRRPESAPRASSREAPILVVAHHSTLLDTFLTFYGTYCLPSPVSRVENSHVPFLGKLIEFSQPVLVKREDPNSRSHTVQEIQRRANSDGQWPQIIIFPEGTCTNRSCLISFKQGAFLPGMPVQPVCIRYPNKLDTVTWTWEGPGAFTQLWLTMCQFYTKVDVMYLPPYHPSEEEKKDPKLYAANVRALMAKCLNCPVTDHTYDDCRLMVSAEKMKMPGSIGLVEFEKLHSKIGVKYDQIADMLRNFIEIKGAKWKDGEGITYDNFSEYLMLPKSEALREVFDLYDRDGSGTIDFREYVIGLSLISNPVNNDDTLKLAFTLFDKENKGHVSLDDLQMILRQAFNMGPEEVEKMFVEVDTKCDRRISYGEFKDYANKKPEYAKVFTTYRETKLAHSLEQPPQFSNGLAREGSAVDRPSTSFQVDPASKKLQ